MGHSNKRKFQVEGNIAHQPLLLTENQNDYDDDDDDDDDDYPFTWYQNIGSMFFHFVTKHPCTDVQTDICYLQDCASIAASRGKNCPLKIAHSKICAFKSGKSRDEVHAAIVLA